jgi:gag-polyprotein putative aspartyl protease
MRMVYADIILVNGEDLALFKRKKLLHSEIRQVTSKMLVDSGSYMMAINEETMVQLGLEPEEERTAQLADGSIIKLPIVSPIRVRFENRTATCSAMVLPGQLLATMLATTTLNETESPMYGTFILGRLWFFVVMQNGQFAETSAFDVLKKEDLYQVAKILKQQKAIILNKLT